MSYNPYPGNRSHPSGQFAAALRKAEESRARELEVERPAAEKRKAEEREAERKATKLAEDYAKLPAYDPDAPIRSTPARSGILATAKREAENRAAEADEAERKVKKFVEDYAKLPVYDPDAPIRSTPTRSGIFAAAKREAENRAAEEREAKKLVEDYAKFLANDPDDPVQSTPVSGTSVCEQKAANKPQKRQEHAQADSRRGLHLHLTGVRNPGHRDEPRYGSQVPYKSPFYTKRSFETDTHTEAPQEPLSKISDKVVPTALNVSNPASAPKSPQLPLQKGLQVLSLTPTVLEEERNWKREAEARAGAQRNYDSTYSTALCLDTPISSSLYPGLSHSSASYPHSPPLHTPSKQINPNSDDNNEVESDRKKLKFSEERSEKASAEAVEKQTMLMERTKQMAESRRAFVQKVFQKLVDVYTGTAPLNAHSETAMSADVRGQNEVIVDNSPTGNAATSDTAIIDSVPDKMAISNILSGNDTEAGSTTPGDASIVDMATSDTSSGNENQNKTLKSNIGPSIFQNSKSSRDEFEKLHLWIGPLADWARTPWNRLIDAGLVRDDEQKQRYQVCWGDLKRRVGKEKLNDMYAWETKEVRKQWFSLLLDDRNSRSMFSFETWNDLCEFMF